MKLVLHLITIQTHIFSLVLEILVLLLVIVLKNPLVIILVLKWDVQPVFITSCTAAQAKYVLNRVANFGLSNFRTRRGRQYFLSKCEC